MGGVPVYQELIMNQIVHNASERFSMLRGIYWHHYPKVQIFHDHTPCKDSAKMSEMLQRICKGHSDIIASEKTKTTSQKLVKDQNRMREFRTA